MVCRDEVEKALTFCSPAPRVYSRDISDSRINKLLGHTNLDITCITSMMMMFLLIISLLSVVSSGARPKSCSSHIHQALAHIRNTDWIPLPYPHTLILTVVLVLFLRIVSVLSNPMLLPHTYLTPGSHPPLSEKTSLHTSGLSWDIATTCRILFPPAWPPE